MTILKKTDDNYDNNSDKDQYTVNYNNYYFHEKCACNSLHYSLAQNFLSTVVRTQVCHYIVMGPIFIHLILINR